MKVANVLFACVANAGRSQMAAAFFNAHADPAKAHATSAGTRPDKEVHPEVVNVMRERKIDIRSATPRYLSKDLASAAHVMVTMGCGDECPLVPGVERLDWPLEDPRGQPVETVRRIRDRIEALVRALIAERQWDR